MNTNQREKIPTGRIIGSFYTRFGGMQVLADDLLRGAPAIAEYLGPAFTVRAVYHLAEKQALPVFKLPNNTTLYARKSELDSAFKAVA